MTGPAPHPDDDLDETMRRLQQAVDEHEAREAERRREWQRAKDEAESFIARKLVQYRTRRR